jgi:hypothetical protein
VAEITAYSFWDTVYIRGAVYAVWVGKSASLLYLAGVFLRMYGLGNSSVFQTMFNVFPSARSEELPPRDADSDPTAPSSAPPLEDTAEKNCN